jgi:hypothetical protein
MDAHSLAIELSPALLWRKSKVSPLESPRKESEPKQTVPAMSLRRFSGTKSHGAKDVMQEKELPPLEQSKISVQVTVPGDDTDDNWRGLQGDFSASLLNFLCYILNPKTCILLTYIWFVQEGICTLYWTTVQFQGMCFGGCIGTPLSLDWFQYMSLTDADVQHVKLFVVPSC